MLPLSVLALAVHCAWGAILVSAGGPFVHIYNPTLQEFQPSPAINRTWYGNDHMLVLGPGNHWHLFGITGRRVHGTGDDFAAGQPSYPPAPSPVAPAVPNFVTNLGD